MAEAKMVAYGPLQSLIGSWKGDKGIDVAPEPEGDEVNPYFEIITFTPIGDLKNAETQVIAALHYRQIVSRKSNNEIFHDETGYWMWDAEAKLIMHALTIPRGVCVLAGGSYSPEKNPEGKIILEVEATAGHSDWGITQSPFMQKKAKTTGFRQKLTLDKDRLSYSETTDLEIYGKSFAHTDENDLVLERN